MTEQMIRDKMEFRAALVSLIHLSRAHGIALLMLGDDNKLNELRVEIDRQFDEVMRLYLAAIEPSS